jgi:circadian clock protein KaiC
MIDAPTTKNPKLTRMPSGIEGLDAILIGGFMRGGMYIIRGSPGAGKTIMTNQICFHHVASGGQALFVTLLAENHARMIANLQSLSFFDESRIPDRLAYISGYHAMRDGGLEELGKLLRREIFRGRATMLVIDGLVSAQNSAPNDAAFREFIHDLQEIALATDCTMFLTTNTSKETSPEHTMVDGLIELTDRIYGWQAESDLQVHKFRGSSFLRGRHSYRITDVGISVHPRIEALLANPNPPAGAEVGRTSTGVDQLDGMLHGGLPVASTTMVMGPSGIGKTTMGLHFLSQCSEVEPGLMFGFYETPTRLGVKAGAMFPSLRQHLDSGVVEVLWQTPTGEPLDAYGARLLTAVRRGNVRRLFIDGLTAFQNVAIERSRIGSFFSALANELRGLGVTTVYSLEVPDILGTAIRVPVDDVSTLAENLILLRFVEERPRLRRLISVLKVRDSDFDSSLHEFVITRNGIEIDDTAGTTQHIPSSHASRDAERAEQTTTHRS